MGSKIAQSVWELAERQHGVVARWQLLQLGFSAQWIKRRLANGRLHAVAWGVYAVGRPQVTQYGRWMAAVLGCGPHAALSHQSAAALWQIRPIGRELHVSVPAGAGYRWRGIVVHRRAVLEPTHRHNIPVTNRS